MLVPATINLSWISNYAGPHRVCYKIVGAPTYTCTVPGSPGPGFHPVCAGGGTPCGYVIDIMVDDETCTQVDYDIYVQPACEDVLSLVGRIPLNLSFIPSPTCKRWEAVCSDSPVASAVINTGGTGYTNAVYPGLPCVGGGGTGATFDVTVAGGIITVVALAAAGSGYTSAPVLDISSIPYTPGTPADIAILLVGCTELLIWDCDGATIESLPLGTLQPTEVYGMCGSAEPTVPADYTISEVNNCLCDCITQNIQSTFAGGTIDYIYIDCNGNVVTGTLTAIDETGDVCMVAGSLFTVVNAPAVLNVIVGAVCDAVAP